MPGTGIRAQIFEALKTQLETNLTWPKNVEWKKLRLYASDLSEHELPLVQFYSTRTDHTHQVQTIESDMTIIIEVVLKQTNQNEVDQLTLYDYIEDVRDAIGSNPNLDVKQCIHVRYVSDELELHIIEPYYYATLEYEVIYKQPYTRNCV